MTRAIGFAARHSLSALRAMDIYRREPGPSDVAIDILFCGVCHSDVHQAKNEWKNTLYPCMPGHEIVGRVSACGSDVSLHKVGDLVGVGCMVDSCRHCKSCYEGLQQYCENGFLATYNGNQRKPSEDNHTYGGYSNSIVVREDFVLKIPANIDPASAAPLVCAGVTTYSPMRHWKVGKGTAMGVVGFGGLGHLATKIGTALGAQVTVITTKAEKADDAMRAGAVAVVDSTDDDAMKQAAMKLDFILSTIPQPHDANPYMALLRRDGVYTVVGCIAPLKAPLDLSTILIDRKSLGTSLIGSIAETQEVLDFCSQHDIRPNIKLIPIQELNEAFKQIDDGAVDFRYVIDMASLNNVTPDDSLAAKVGL